ncbi:TnsA endonuclease (modular protein) [Cupriavidus taiwanensis]|nr:TnsA endonuclease (modular protein) [Cupriavidus taiwanensis]
MADYIASSPRFPGRTPLPINPPYHGTRNPVRPSGRGFRGKFASRKMRRMVRCESLLEMWCLHLAEFARGIASYQEQPICISYRCGGRTRRYTPDFRFSWDDGREWYVEVKPRSRAHTDENQEKFAEIERYFDGSGAKFVLLTEVELKHPHRLPQVQYLLSKIPSDSAYEDSQIASAWEGRDQVTFAESEELLGGRLRLIEGLARRELACDLTQPIEAHTAIRLFRGDDDVALFI